MKYRICMVSDFYYPNMGGVEMHIYQLSQCLLERGHKVIVVTHVYGDRVGVRWMTSGLKVYYLPVKPIYNQSTLPTVFTGFPLLRQIFIREGINLVHGHSSFSTLAHEAMLHGRAMGIRCVFTDHSLFGFANASSIITNKVLKFSLAGVNHVVCVSHTAKENTVLRARINPAMVSVIPNAVDVSKFTPDPGHRSPNRIVIVAVSRLCYRKGTDLLAAIIPEVCGMFPDVDFLIAGHGDKWIDLEEIREKHGLHDRMKLLGEVQHRYVRDVLIQGNIFLNTSLTEAFCIAIVEAASCGLSVVTTNVGGIPEVLPDDLVYMANPTAYSLVNAIADVIPLHREGRALDPWYVHNRVKDLYTWPDVAFRVEAAYQRAFANDKSSTSERLMNYNAIGPVSGKIYMLVAVAHILLLSFLDWFWPASDIELAYDYSRIKAESSRRSGRCG